jgi:glutathione S-transferase
MRARLALAVSRQAVEHREVSLKAKPPEMLSASPKGTVPVLILADGTVIDESLDIMRWALALKDPEGWLVPGAEMDALIAINDGQFKHHLDRAKYPGRYDDAVEVDHRAAAVDLLLPLEARLAGTTFLFGARAALADYALFPFVRQFARIDAAAWVALPLPGLQHWVEQISASTLFAAIMKKHPLWQSPLAIAAQSPQ